MSDHEPPVPPAPAGITVSVLRVAWQGLRDLLRSRRSILLDHYRVVLATFHEHPLDATATLEQARETYLNCLQAKSISLDRSVDSTERIAIVGTRFCGLWIVAWMMLFPLVVTALLAFFLAQQPNNAPAFIAAIGIVVFCFASFCGLFLQSIFARPVMTLVNRWLAGDSQRAKQP